MVRSGFGLVSTMVSGASPFAWISVDSLFVKQFSGRNGDQRIGGTWEGM